MKTQIDKLYVVAFSPVGNGISGGDRIGIELSKRWSRIFPIEIVTWEDGVVMYKREGIKEDKSLKFNLIRLNTWRRLGFVVNYLVRIIAGIFWGLTVKIDSKNIYVYSASDFWMDSLACFLVKLRYPKVKWVACWFQTAPNPIFGFAEGERSEKYRLSALLYWLVQLPVKPLISRLADFVLVNNEMERKQFSDLEKKGKVIVVLGGVDVKKISNFKFQISNFQKKYDAVFQGRFHPQKGVVELVEIWRKVVDKIPGAKLVMIGDGSLMSNVKYQISNSKLDKNIILKGYLFDGEEKYKMFSESKIVVHPAFFDSGGMAAAEAMVFGLPGVGFNLASYESYYPKGMIKVTVGDLDAFAGRVVKLLKNDKQRLHLGKEAAAMVKHDWGWDKRAEHILKYFQN